MSHELRLRRSFYLVPDTTQRNNRHRLTIGGHGVRLTQLKYDLSTQGPVMKLVDFLPPSLRAVSTGFIAVVLWGAVALAGSQLPMVWMDDGNGYAIAGYDPVDYFVKGQPVRPDTGIEAVWGGVSWNFRNVGNRGAFLSHPHIYAPRFGGMDPYFLAKDQSVRGNPILFDVFENHLYLFYNGGSLLQWKQGRKGYSTRAALAWPKAAIDLGLSSSMKIKPLQADNKNGFLVPPPQ